MEIEREVHKRRRGDRATTSLERFASIRCFRRPLPHAPLARLSKFEPGARTAWHTHPLGQTLVVTAGFGRVHRWDGPLRKSGQATSSGSRQGEKHWHGASPTTALTHIAVQEQLDGKNVEWMEQVSDDQSRAEQIALRNAHATRHRQTLARTIGAAETPARRGDHQRRRLGFDYGDESVSVALEEVAAAEWGEKVYRPDIVEKAATLYKKPGYEM